MVYRTAQHGELATVKEIENGLFWRSEILEPELRRAQVELQFVAIGDCRAALAPASLLKLISPHE